MINDFLIRNRMKQGIKFISRNQSVLDFGCGGGQVLGLLPKGVRYTGVDIDEVKLERNRLKFKRRFYSVGRFLKNSVKKFDSILMFSVLEHIDAPDSVVLNLANRLKPNGKIVIITPSPKAELVLQALDSVGVVSNDELQEHTLYYTRLGLEKLFYRTGLELVYYKNFQLGFNQLVVGTKK